MVKRPSTRQTLLGALLIGASSFAIYILDSLVGVVTSVNGSVRGTTPQVDPYLDVEGMGAIGYIRKNKEISNETPADSARHVPVLPDRPSAAPSGDR